MENSSKNNGEETRNQTITSTSSTTSSDDYRLFGRQGSLHQFLGGGKAADILLWEQWSVSVGVIVVATVAWLIFERSGLPFLSICSDVLLILIVVLFFRSNYAAYRDGQPQTLPELELSEEMVTNAAASFRVKINNVLLMAHEITLVKDFRIIFKVVICLWLLSTIGSYCSFFTLASIGTILSVTLPAVYSKYEEQVDKYCGMIQRKFSQQYKIVDDSVTNRIPRSLSKDKDI
ncbi:Reticulon-like protein B16 [Hibiscus syriacus]|uniref:Reticulon-like protein n=1 Tax=Hibiscus syriacus TaxID=106335 RepID=A0A6A3CUB1_HIBSY|nr:reticulon-like protein B16 [Hibiscus syriacus]KAE8733155.1 Reticulon-like protein B16 [Hibiscus syriacus]